MDLPENFATMDPAHREHFERMRNLVARLTDDLQAAHDKAAADRLKAAVEMERLTLWAADQRAAARRSAAEVVQLLRALRDLHRAVRTRNGPHITPAEVREIVRAHRAAGEVLKLLDIPF